MNDFCHKMDMRQKKNDHGGDFSLGNGDQINVINLTRDAYIRKEGGAMC